MRSCRTRATGAWLAAALACLLGGLSGCQLLTERSHLAEEVAALREALQAQQVQLDALRTETAPAEKPSAKQADPDAAAGWQPVSFKPDFQLHGRINVDAVVVDQSAQNKQTVGDLENATGFRRARLGGQGRIGEQVHWLAEFDFASRSVKFINVWLGVDRLPLVDEVRVGYMFEPLSLETLTSSNWTTFLERTGNNPLDPGQNWGVLLLRTAEDGRSSFQLGGFRAGSDDTGLDVTDQGDWALTTRATRLLWYDEASEGRTLFHVGGAFSYRRPLDGIATFRERSGARLIAVGEPSSTPFFPTLSISANQFQQYNLEAAAVCGPLSLQAEWGCAAIPQTGGGFVFLHGGYVALSYFLTGEHRGYRHANGTMDLPRVQSPFFLLQGLRGVIRGPGAWELAGRFDFTDFRDPDIPPGPGGIPLGDLLIQGTIGLNWYLNDSTRVMLNYLIAELQSPAYGTSHGCLFSARFAVYW